MTRLYLNMPLCVGQAILLPEDAARHAVTVLRMKVTDPVTLFNGKGGEYLAVIHRIEKRKVTVHVMDFVAASRESPLSLHWYQGLCRSDRMDTIIQKLVELGVSCITPVMTDHSTIKLTQERLQKKYKHWNGVIKSASEQCGRNELPQIKSLTRTTELDVDINKKHVLLHPSGPDALRDADVTHNTLHVYCGPEGGWSEHEVERFSAQGGLVVSLGPRILRVETAAISTNAIIQYLWGDLSQ